MKTIDAKINFRFKRMSLNDIKKGKNVQTINNRDSKILMWIAVIKISLKEVKLLFYSFYLLARLAYVL
jgi:hypothetical protein